MFLHSISSSPKHNLFSHTVFLDCINVMSNTNHRSTYTISLGLISNVSLSHLSRWHMDNTNNLSFFLWTFGYVCRNLTQLWWRGFISSLVRKKTVWLYDVSQSPPLYPRASSRTLFSSLFLSCSLSTLTPGV